MNRWLTIVLLLMFGLLGSCSRDDDSIDDHPIAGTPVQAQLVGYSGLGYEVLYDNGVGETFHGSSFVVVSPSSLCGAALEIKHSQLPTVVDDWPMLGYVFRLRITDDHADHLRWPNPPGTSSVFMYPHVPIVSVLGKGAENEECF